MGNISASKHGNWSSRQVVSSANQIRSLQKVLCRRSDAPVLRLLRTKVVRWTAVMSAKFTCPWSRCHVRRTAVFFFPKGWTVPISSRYQSTRSFTVIFASPRVSLNRRASISASILRAHATDCAFVGNVSEWTCDPCGGSAFARHLRLSY